eukprot:scaffold267364_cov19-Prasinocladus_malaysianus.AAC.1
MDQQRLDHTCTWRQLCDMHSHQSHKAGFNDAEDYRCAQLTQSGICLDGNTVTHVGSFNHGLAIYNGHIVQAGWQQLHHKDR